MWGVAMVPALWFGSRWPAVVVRGLLAPLSWLFGAAVQRRNARYDARPPVRPLLPTMSIGNLTVGGTGKTPGAAWCVQALRARGAAPAIVLRGVGDDEWRVHELLNPGVPIVVAPDRVAGIAEAKARGADCVVLDDAFQHRQAPRTIDVVLVSADAWTGAVRLLPAGPFREPLQALRRADLVVITTKSAAPERVGMVQRAIADRVAWTGGRETGTAVIRLAPGRVRSAPSGHASALDDPSLSPHPDTVEVAGIPVGLVSGIGNPEAFGQQVRGLGPRIVSEQRFADHHAFSASDVLHILATAAGAQAVICTLKDAVKLAPLWPRAGLPLWYLSQSVVVAQGADSLERAMQRVLAAREPSISTAG
jgi:tetraacyldisaccharide 4'-kinase